MSSRYALKVLNKYWDGNFPILPRAIAGKMGVTVTSLNESQKYFGKFDIDKNKKPIIFYNKTENVYRRRFTVAHELGHYV